MNRYFRAGLMVGQIHSMTQGERMELRVRRMIEWRSWWEKVLGRAFPMREERNHLRWPDVPNAKWERYCDGWGCTKKVPAGRLVCPWCGRFEDVSGLGWMDIAAMLYAPRETRYTGDGIARTVITDEEHGECHRIVEQITRTSEEAPELKTEIVVEVPAETARAWLEAQGVTGDQ